ncbi:MAG: mandelate racemase/muconate lactonizing enzyme family protein [Geminicoccaceae bacterium]
MQIADVAVELLRMPLPRPMLSGSSGGAGSKPVTHINMPIVSITTDNGIEGIGFAWNLMGGGGATKSLLVDDITPLLLDQDPLDHERLWRTIYRRLQSVGRAGLVTQAQAAVDLALWDIKGKAAGMPVWQLLGGMRSDAPVYGSDGGWLYMTVDEMLDHFEAYLSQGMFGVKMKVGHADPEIDIERVREVRERLGGRVWLAVDANQQWNYDKAVMAGRAFEKLGVAWLEEPLICEDLKGHARLVDKLDIPIALGETLASRFEFASYINQNAVDTLQPDVIRAGGITECAKIVHLADAAGRSVAFHHIMEVSIHLVCGLLAEGPIEYMPWIAGAFAEEPEIKNGRMTAPSIPGLGLSIPDGIIERYRVA